MQNFAETKKKPSVLCSVKQKLSEKCAIIVTSHKGQKMSVCNTNRLLIQELCESINEISSPLTWLCVSFIVRMSAESYDLWERESVCVNQDINLSEYMSQLSSRNDPSHTSQDRESLQQWSLCLLLWPQTTSLLSPYTATLCAHLHRLCMFVCV